MSINPEITAYWNRQDAALMAEAGGDGELACRLLWSWHEHFDGEYTIGYSAELQMRRRLGLPTADCERKLREAHEAEDRMIAEYHARQGR